MKVKELIKILSCYPMDAEVVTDTPDSELFNEILHVDESRWWDNSTVILFAKPINDEE